MSTEPLELATVDRDCYEILSELARGGLGRILRARDRRTGRVVAIKQVLGDHEALAARFAREALITANLQHPAIVPVYEVGRWPSGEPFYAMKLVAGRSLEHVARRARTLPERIALVSHVIAVADALAYAHSEHVIHRDLKPANVLAGDFGETVVIDWGLAKNVATGFEVSSPAAEGSAAEVTAAAGAATVMGAIVGTPGYMAPEQARGEPADQRADVFAIGALLYEVLTGVPPYAEAPDARRAIERAQVAGPRPVREIEPELPVEITAIVDRATAFEPADRYPSAAELAADLRRYRTGKLVSAHDYSIWQLVRRWIGRHRTAVVVGALALLALVVLGVVSVIRISEARDRAEAAQTIAESRLAALHEELGRQRLVAGHPDQALPYLVTAMAGGRAEPATGFLAARALEHLDPLVAVLPHDTQVSAAAFSAGGKTVITAASDGRLRFWDVASGRLESTLDRGLTMALAPDGDHIVTIDASGGAPLLSGDGAPRATLWLPEVGTDPDAPRALAFSSDGARLAIGGRGGAVAWWRTADPHQAPIALAEAHAGYVRVVRFAADGRRLITAGEDHRARVWDSTSGARIAELTVSGVVHDAALSPDGARAIIAGDDGAALWEVQSGTGSVPLTGHDGPVYCARVSRDGARALTCGDDRRVIIWDVARGERLTTLAGHQARVREAVFSPDGGRVATRSEDYSARVWEASSGVELVVLAGHRAELGDVAFSPDGRLVVTASLDGEARVWRTGRASHRVELATGAARVWRGAFTPDGAIVATAGADGTARLWDADRGEPRGELEGHRGELRAVAVTSDGARVVTVGDDRTGRIWDLASGAERATLSGHGDRVRWVAASPDGARLATASADASVRIWDAATGRPLRRIAPGHGPLRKVIWSPDGTRLATASDASMAGLWDPESGAAIAELPLRTEQVLGIAFSPDSALLALSGRGAQITLADAESGAVVGVLDGHSYGMIMTLAFSPDGRTLASSSWDPGVRTWDVASRSGRLVLADGEAAMMATAFAASGAIILGAGDDGVLRAWDADSGALLWRGRGDPAGIVSIVVAPAGDRALLLGLGGHPVVVDLSRWLGSASELEAGAGCSVPWELDAHAALVARRVPAGCTRAGSLTSPGAN